MRSDAPPSRPGIRLFPITAEGSTNAPEVGRPPEFADIVAQTVALYQRRGYNPPWIGYVAAEGNRSVGATGFVGSPLGDEVELAYFTFPGEEGRGVATAMARELMSRARAESEERPAFIAHTLPTRGASTAILGKLGFELIGSLDHAEDGVVWKWRKPLP